MHKQPIRSVPPPVSDPGVPADVVAIGDLLAQAAALCVQQGLDVDTFMRGAWAAYVEARPGLRDYLEEMQLLSQLDELRKLGRMGEA